MSLSPTEVKILKQVASGRTRKQVASDLALSEASVQFSLKKIRTKLGAVNRTDSVVLALKSGELKLEELKR